MTEQEMAELNAWIAENVMGLYRIDECEASPLAPKNEFFVTAHGVYQYGTPYYKQLNYTTDPAAAMLVLEKILSVSGMDGISVNLGIWGFDIELNSNRDIKITSSTLPLAICLFARQLFGKDAQ